jgi:hypothetical protein
MKPAFLLFCCLNLAGAADLSVGRTVYLVPMGHSLDQFIASRLTRMHVMQVVTDPAKADIIVTDNVGQAFEDRLNDLYPPPEAAATKQAPKEQAPKEKAPSPKPNEMSGPIGPPSIFGDTVNKAESTGNMAVTSRSRGTIFLVDVKSRQVVWSAFERPKSFAPGEMDRTAERIVKKLKEDLTPK